MNGETVVLLDGLQVFEVEGLCRVLEDAGVGFRVDGVSDGECGVVEVRPNNWAAGLTSVCNGFNRGGTTVHMRISVLKEDFEKAAAALEAAKKSSSVDRKTLLIAAVTLALLFLLLYAFKSRTAARDESRLPYNAVDIFVLN